MYRTEIAYDHELRDYAMYVDGELVGFAHTYHEAEIMLDQLVFEIMSGTLFQRDDERTKTPAAEAGAGAKNEGKMQQKSTTTG